MTCLSKGAIAGLALMLLGGPASADIVAFNAAVQAGDYRAAALEASIAWPSVDKASPDAAAIAREFGWAAMLAGDPSAALVYARFLIEQGSALPHPDTSPAVSRVLHDWAVLAATSSPTTRSRLLGALQARATLFGRDLISARAAQLLQVEAWEAGDWPQAETAAYLVSRFLQELGAAQSPARFAARRQLAVANFMRTRAPENYGVLYDVATEVHGLIATTPPGQIRDRLASEYFSATAWGDTVYAALGAARQRQTPERRTGGAGRPPIADLLFPAPGDPALPRCRISLARGAKTPGFPFVQRFKDVGGSVVFALDLAPNGLFVNPRLLGSAPHADFVTATQEVMSSWRWRLEDDQRPEACRMPQTHVMTFAFALGR